MDSEGGVHFERQGLLPPLVPDSREGGRPPFCSLNIDALPAQDEPTCICGRGCPVKLRLLLQSFCTRLQHPCRRLTDPGRAPPALPGVR